MWLSISLAIQTSLEKRLTLNGIYNYRNLENEGEGWKNSIRYNL